MSVVFYLHHKIPQKGDLSSSRASSWNFIITSARTSFPSGRSITATTSEISRPPVTWGQHIGRLDRRKSSISAVPKEKRRDFEIPALRALGGFGANRRPNLPNLPHQSEDINEKRPSPRLCARLASLGCKLAGVSGRKSSDEPPGGERVSRLPPQPGFPSKKPRRRTDRPKLLASKPYC